jgi:hypothetical protein
LGPREAAHREVPKVRLVGVEVLEFRNDRICAIRDYHARG